MRLRISGGKRRKGDSLALRWALSRRLVSIQAAQGTAQRRIIHLKLFRRRATHVEQTVVEKGRPRSAGLLLLLLR